ncbi:MAG: HEPN domain-containing protein [Bdellovibrionota bacterium]
MTPFAKSMILKAQDNIDTAKAHLEDPSQHEVAGYNLAQAVECMLKALLQLREVEIPEGDDSHDLDVLLSLLEEDNMVQASSHADVVELTPYNNARAHIDPDDRLDLKEWLGYVEDLKGLVKESVT